MPRRRTVLAALATVALGGCSQDGSDASSPTDSGAQATTTREEESTETGGSPFTLSSPAFEAGGEIPVRFTADGDDVSPPLELANPPDGTATFAVVVDDPDAPGSTFVHWVLWNVGADVREIPAARPREERLEDPAGARQGTNDFDEVGYRGPAPPADDDAHTYRFRCYALETEPDLDPGARRDALVDAMDGHVLGRTEFTGRYGR